METKRTRPNANYKLSRENPDKIEEEKLKFYYDRQHRLDKAPENVRKLYEEPLQKFSLLRPLIASKGRATLFFTIVILCVVILMLSLMGFMDRAYLLEGNKVEISASIIDEDSTLIVIKKTVDSKEPYTGAVNIGVSPANQKNEYPIETFTVFFTLREEENCYFEVPFYAPTLAMVLQTEKSALKITVVPE